MSVVGRGQRRLEGADKVAGVTRYTADLEIAGLLHVQVVLSPLPAARIKSIDTAAAAAAPGVVGVFTGADLASTANGPDKPLAVDRVFFGGQAVAAVVAVSETAATDAAALVDVDLEAIPAVTNAEVAMREGAPQVLETVAETSEEDAAVHGAATASESEPTERPPNVTAVASFKRGNVAKALAGADVVFKQTYRLAGVHHSPLEPHVAIARPEADGGVTIWAPTQGPFALREDVAKVLGVPAYKVRVIPMPVGGGFGGKVILLEVLLSMLELRLRNASKEGDPSADRSPWPRIAMIECLEAARRHPLYTAPVGAGEGVGVALGSWGGARTPAAAGCRVEPDGTLSIVIGTPDVSGATTGLAMIAAEAFGVSTDKVRIQTGETDTAPHGPIAAGSQTTYSIGGAVQEAALEARRQLLEIATDELEAAPEDLEISDGRVSVRGVPDRFVEITRLVAASTEFMGRHKPIHASGRSAVLSASPQFTVQIARVRTDPETGAFQLTGYAAIQDVGKAINPPEVEGQIHGGAAQALGRALGEQLAFDSDGQLRTGSFLDYELPTADQLPDIDVSLIEIPSPVGPLGAKGVGEPPAIPGPAALANALARATGTRVREVPVDRSALVKERTGARSG